MRFTAVGNFLQFDKNNDNVFMIGNGGGIGAELAQTFQTVGISEDQLWEGNDNLRVDGNHALWVWAHGNRHRNCIAAGPDEIVSPVKLAKMLAKLNKASTGQVIVWSCYAGAADGFVQHFAATMQALGYAGLHFWGYKHITYGMEAADGQWADLYGEDPTLKFSGDLAPSKAGANYGKARANQASMSGFGPGLKAPFTRSYDF
jgi:hypothetical protein